MIDNTPVIWGNAGDKIVRPDGTETEITFAYTVLSTNRYRGMRRAAEGPTS